MKIKFKKLHPAAKIPERAHSHDAGFDLTCLSYKGSVGSEYLEYDTGIAVDIPPGYVGLLFPRSSISKYNLSLANSVGVVDAGYHNSIKMRFRGKQVAGLESDDRVYSPNQRIGQLVILELPSVEFIEGEFGESERGENGFGSTGE